MMRLLIETLKQITKNIEITRKNIPSEKQNHRELYVIEMHIE